MDFSEVLAQSEYIARIGVVVERLFIVAFLAFCFYAYFKDKKK